MSEPTADALIAGGGLSGLSLAAHLAAAGWHDRRVLLIDDAPAPPAVAAWGFWSARPGLLDTAVSRTYRQVYVHAAGACGVVPLGGYRYQVVRRADLRRTVLELLAACPRYEVVPGRVEAVRAGPGAAELTVDGRVLRAGWAFDSVTRPPAAPVDAQLAFTGWRVRCARAVFDPETPTLFDFRTAQAGAARFVYVLPEDRHRALVEVTEFVPRSATPSTAAERGAAVGEYLHEVLRGGGHEVLGTESAVLPLRARRPARRAGRVLAIGARAGLVKASTGYGYQRIQRDSAAIARSLGRHGHPFDLPRPRRRFQVFDRLLLEVLDRDPVQVEFAFARLLLANPVQRVLRFLDEDSRIGDELALIASLPPRPYLRALARRTIGPGRPARESRPRSAGAVTVDGRTMFGSMRPQVRWYARPAARDWRCPPPPESPRAFHAALSGYRPTPLVELPTLAGELEVGRVLVKDESQRLGLPAFKVLGAAWAAARLFARRAGLARPVDLDALRAAATRSPATLVAATDGNHGRAVARMASLLGLPAHIFVPQFISDRVAGAIAAEGAVVTRVAGDYDKAVAAAAGWTSDRPDAVLVQDAGWPGYHEVPGWIVDGYSTLMLEVHDGLSALGLAGPDLVVVPVGVGSLAQAVVTHSRSRAAGRPAVLGVEPDTAACVLASLQAGELRSVPTGETVMAGLNCGTPSGAAWPCLRDGLDAAVAVADPQAVRAAADLAALGVSSGLSGAASLAGARVALTGPGAPQRRGQLGVGAGSVVVLLSTEGAG